MPDCKEHAEPAVVLDVATPCECGGPYAVLPVLAIVNLLALAFLAGREEIRVAAAADRPRFEAEHAPETDPPWPCVRHWSAEQTKRCK
jgi:hypothetical protein